MRQRSGAVFWSGLEAASAAALSFASAFLIARLVGPAELGIGAAVVAPQVLLCIAVNALFADAIAQRPRSTSKPPPAPSGPRPRSAVWRRWRWRRWAACGARPCRPAVPAMAALLALPLPLVGAGGAAQGILTCQRRYRDLAGRTIVGQGLGTAIGIGLALSGAGAWAVVAQQTVTSLVGAAALLLRAGWRPRWSVRLAAVRQLTAVGLPLVASTLVQHGRYRLFALAIGDVAGAATLGQVHLAFRLVDTVRDLTATALWRLMLPAFAARQHRQEELCGALDRCLALSALALFPLWGAMALTTGPLVALLLGPVWADAVGAALPLIGLACWTSLGFPAGVAAVARGATGYALAANIAATLLTLGAAVLLRPATPHGAVAIWVAAQLALAPYMSAERRARAPRCRRSGRCAPVCARRRSPRSPPPRPPFSPRCRARRPAVSCRSSCGLRCWAPSPSRRCLSAPRRSDRSVAGCGRHVAARADRAGRAGRRS